MCDWCRTGSWGGQLESRTAENSRTIAKVPGCQPWELELDAVSDLGARVLRRQEAQVMVKARNDVTISNGGQKRGKFQRCLGDKE